MTHTAPEQRMARSAEIANRTNFVLKSLQGLSINEAGEVLRDCERRLNDLAVSVCDATEFQLATAVLPPLGD